jgi:hypothetical protein
MGQLGSAGVLMAAFYKGTASGISGIYDRGIRWWTRSAYSHVELVLPDGRAASSSYRDGGVRYKHIDFNPEKWDLVALPGQLVAGAIDWFDRHEGDAYDLMGDLHFVLSPIADSEGTWFCSEAVGAALGLPDPARFDPGTLYAVLSFFTQPASAGFFSSTP